MKILLLCNRYLSPFDCAVIQSLRSSGEIEIVGALINTRSKGSLLNRAKKEWKKGRGGFILVQAFRTIVSKFIKKEVVCVAENFLAGIHVKSAAGLYNDEVYQWIRERAADCILLRGFGIIKDPILSICPYGVLSYHHGDLRKYRGGPPAFWELYNGEKEIGVTLQILDHGLDTGTIVLQKFLPISRTETWGTLRKAIYRESTSLALDAILKLKASEPFQNPVGPVGQLYTLPNLNQWLNLQFKLLKRRFSR